MKTSSKIILILSGLLMIATGIVALCSPTTTLVSLALVIGIDTLISGIMTLFFYFDEARGKVGAGTILFDAIANIIFGILFLSNSILVASILPFLFSMWAVFIGIQMIIHCTDWRKIGVKHWWIELIYGILFLALGILSCIQPIFAAVTISIFVGIAFIFHGFADFYIVFETNKIENRLQTIADVIQNKIGAEKW